MNIGDIVTDLVYGHAGEHGVVKSAWADGSLEVTFGDGDYILNPGQFTPIIVRADQKVSPRKTRQLYSDYKVSHNMRPYLAAAIGLQRPDLRSMFTEKEKSIPFAEQQVERENATLFLEMNPAFLVLIDALIARGVATPFGIQLPVEIYRWDLETAASIGFTDASYINARAKQEQSWHAKNNGEIHEPDTNQAAPLHQ